MACGLESRFPPLCFTRSCHGALAALTALRGSYLKTRVESRGPIRHQDIIRPGEQGFIVASLAPGMRAVSMAVTQVSGVSGFVAPGDRVDVLLIHKVDDTSDKPVLTPRQFTETILTDLRLLAIEQVIDAATGKPKVGGTVTLEVTPQQAEVDSLADAMGNLSLSLICCHIGTLCVVINKRILFRSI